MIILPPAFGQIQSSYYDVLDPVVILETNLGNLVIGFFPNDAPNHVVNFLKLAQFGYYDNTLFHRIIPGFMIQGGDPNTIDGEPNTWGLGGPNEKLNSEFNSIKHNRGIVSMARSQDPNSAGSQFFIVHENSNFLDENYTVFGRLITKESFETLDKIASVSTDERDRPLQPEPVRITKVSVIPLNEISNLIDLSPPERTLSDIQPFSKQIFTNEELEIQISFPDGWLLQQPQKMNEFIPDIVAVGPLSGKTNSQIYLTISDSEKKSFEEIVDEINTTILDYEKDKNFTILLKEMTTINGMKAYVVDATEFSEQLDTKIKFRTVTIFTDTEYYTLTYANDIESYESDFSKFIDTLNSFNTTSTEQNLIKSEKNESNENNTGGGCLIATAAFDSELAPQVQKLREIRDSKLLQTESGSQFISSFNQFYYSFSPYVADYERENPIFKEMVKIGITPMITTLSIMDYAESESEVLGFGISVILMNMGMYFAVPVIIIYRIKKLF